MSKVRCIIVEDEPLAQKVLSDYITQVPFLELRASFRDAIQATEYLRDHEVDLIFLDIHLPKLKGMAFLKTLVKPPSVIVTTAYHQYAVEGFDLNVTDYLLKPFEFERFLVAVNKVRQPVRAATVAAKDHLYLTVQKKKIRIPLSEIIYAESQREYVKLVTTKKTYFSKLTTNELEEMLPADRFRRIHRSYIIALDKVNSYSADTVEVTGISLPVGRAYRDVLNEL